MTKDMMARAAMAASDKLVAAETAYVFEAQTVRQRTAAMREIARRRRQYDLFWSRAYIGNGWGN